MYFNVKFFTKSSMILNRIGDIGLDAIDDVRETFPETKDLQAEDIRVENSCPFSKTSYSIYLTEQEARESGLFGGTRNVSVEVPFDFLGSFVHLKKLDTFHYDIIIERPVKKFLGFVYDKGETKHIISSFSCSYSINDDALKKWWIGKEYPLDILSI